MSLRVFLFAHLVLLPWILQCSHYEGLGRLQYEAHPDSQPLSAKNVADEPFQLHWPVKKVHISQKFKRSRHKKHDGLDLTHYRGAPILAAHSGYVIYTGSQYSGYGKMVIVEFDNTWATLYAHLNKIKVKEGDRVQVGDRIGTMGRTGRATGTHLHFEVLKNKVPIDPLSLLSPQRNLVRN